MVREMRAAAILALILASSGAGCLSSRADAEYGTITVPWPASSDRAIFSGSSGTLHVEVGPPRSIADAAGAAVEVLPLQWNVMGDGMSYMRYAEFLDASGHLVLSLSPCEMGGYSAGLACRDARRASGTYFEYGMYGALGMSWAWGKELREGPHSVVFGMGGFEQEVDYEFRAIAGSGCLAGRTTDGARTFQDQMLVSYVAIPEAFVVCDGEPFAREVELDGGSWDRIDASTSAGAPAVPRGIAVDPRMLPPDPRAKRGLPIPQESAYSPVRFSLATAWEHLSSENAETRDFLRTHGGGFVRYSNAFLTSYGSFAPGAVPFDDLMESKSEMTIVVEGEDGAVAQVELKQACALSQCEVVAGPLTPLHLDRSVEPRADVLAVPLPVSMELANRTLTQPTRMFGVGTVLRGSEAPDTPSGGRSLATFRALPEGESFGAPYKVVIDGTSARILIFDIPWVKAAELTNVDIEATFS